MPSRTIQYIVWAALIILLLIGIFAPPIPNVGPVGGVAGWLAAGLFSAGILSAGLFSAGVFSAGVFSVGIVSVGVFSLGVVSFGTYAAGIWADGQFALSLYGRRGGGPGRPQRRR